MKLSILSIALPFLTVCTAAAQKHVFVPSGTADIVLSVWEAEHPRDTVVVLLPGFGSAPPDFLGIAEHLSDRGYTTIYLTPRGWYGSRGFYSYSNAIGDIEMTVGWARDRYLSQVILGGYSWGGALALYQASQDSSISQVFALAPADQAEFYRKYKRDSVYAGEIDGWLRWSSGPDGWLRFEEGYDIIQDLGDYQEILDLVDNARQIDNRSVLLMGGWHDKTLEDTIIPLYRVLKSVESSDVELIVFDDDHSYQNSGSHVGDAIMRWLRQ